MTPTPDLSPLRHREGQRVILVTGPSGGGRTTALNVLEDMGFETITNLPLRFLSRLLEGTELVRPLALGLDVRNRDYSVQGILDALRDMRADSAVAPELLFVECDRAALLRRYSETRRRHPLAQVDSPKEGVDAELALLRPIRENADTIIDTTDLSPHDLKRELKRWYGDEGNVHLGLTVESFSYKKGIPQGLDMVFDCRFLRNPHWDPELRKLTGMNPPVVDYVMQDPLAQRYFDQVCEMVEMMLPAVQHEGRAHLSIGFGCTGGKHRSVTMAEKLAAALAEKDWRVSIRHREMDRWGDAATAGIKDVTP